MKYRLFILLFVFISINSLAQNSDEQIITCGSDIIHNQFQKNNKQYQQEYKKHENRYQKVIWQHSPFDRLSKFVTSTQNNIYTLPIVVHIIHNNGTENITDAQVQNAIQYLNDAYSNQGYYNPNTGVNTDISFCLAQRDPQGNHTNGINRIQSSLTEMEYSTEDILLKNLSRWNPKEYINIWVVRDICMNGKCKVTGYAFLPYTHGAPFDGIVMESRFFGSSEARTTVLIHEMGHYLGLFHTFKGGCENDDCLIYGDKICDTPPDNTTGSFPCNSAINSCKTDEDDISINNPYRSISLGGLGEQNDMFQNYMDYSNSNCYDRFTLGQKERMFFFLENIRNSLLESKSCSPPCNNVVKADFTANNTNIDVGETINFTNQSTNADSYRWYINGTLISTNVSPSYYFDTKGEYNILLEAITNDPACEITYDSILITVTCPVIADFDYTIDTTHISFENKSTNALSIKWSIKKPNGDEIFNSTTNSDFYNFTIAGYYRLCIEAENSICIDTNCIYIQIFTPGIEICDNEIDDDGDGMVDLFDPDCPCSDSVSNQNYQALCPIECEYIPDSFPEFKMKLKWESDYLSDSSSFFSPNFVIGDINSNGSIEIISQKSIGNGDNNKNAINGIMFFKGTNGDLLDEFNTTIKFDYGGFSYIAIGDINKDGMVEIFFRNFNKNTIVCYNIFGNQIWESDYLGNIKIGDIVNLSDFNQDGISEVYINNYILNAQTGDILVKGVDGGGCNPFANWSSCNNALSVAGDFLPSPGLELAAGNTVYEINLINSNGSSGNSMIPIIADSPVKDGFTSIVDIDEDGLLDIITARGTNAPDGGGIWIWNPRTKTIIAKASAKEMGGIPFVGDVDGDCVPEIGLSFRYELKMYKYDTTQNLKLLYSLPTSDYSGRTSIAMFDFNQDGKNELVYRDETDLKIIEGSTGKTLASYPVNSGTWLESPIVADIDNDGQAEIVVNGYTDNPNETRIFAFESAGAPWAPARSVWNQTAYNVTNVNDDLTIPRYPQNPAAFIQGTDSCARPTCPQVYNSFMAQATYRTQNGCVQFPTVDLEPKLIDWECDADSIILSFVVYNLSDALAALDRYGVAVYDNNPLTSSANILGSRDVDMAIGISAMSNDTFKITIPYQNISGKIYLVVNDKTFQVTPFVFPLTKQPECNYSNNIDSIDINNEVLTLDLGDDISRCENGVVTLNAGSGFASYLWSDGRTDSIFSTSFDGLHFVEVTDVCGIVYRDTVTVTTDPNTVLTIEGEVREFCPGEVISYSVLDKFDGVNWFPAEKVDCDTCKVVEIVADTSFLLIGISEKDGCYSSDTVKIVVKPPMETEISESICRGDSVLFYDNTLFDSGIYEHTVGDCDSIITLNLEVTESVYSDIKESICIGDSILVGGDWWDTSGSYVITVASSIGCDSIINLDLIVEENIENKDQLELCKGDSIKIFDNWVYEAGDYYKNFVSQGGCDSVQIYNVAILDQEYSYDTLQICVGDSVFVVDEWLSEEGNYIDTIDNSVCGIIQNTRLEVLDFYLVCDSITLCPGDSVQIEGEWISSSGKYTYNLTSHSGCDSVYIANVSKLIAPDSLVMEIDCDEPVVRVEVTNFNHPDTNFNHPNFDHSWSVLWSNGDTTSSTTYQGGEDGNVVLNSEPDCQIQYNFEIPELPDFSQLPYFADTLVNSKSVISLKLGLDAEKWQVEWSPVNIIDCSSCMDVNINATENVEIIIRLIHSSGCIYTKTFSINIDLNDDIYIPNVFTPDGDGYNDTWYVTFKDYHPTIIEAAIFDRWGEKIAEWHNVVNVDWDGMFKGEKVNSGVYVYFIKYMGRDGKEAIVKGDVTVLY